MSGDIANRCRLWGAPTRQRAKPLLKEAADALDAKDKRIAELGAAGWQPIDTAPKDGTRVDVWVRPWDAFASGNPNRITNAWFEDGKWKRILSGWTMDIKDCGAPTHWRPVPIPPSFPTGDANE